MNRLRYTLAFVLLVVAAALQGGADARGPALSCTPGLTQIACENAQPGDPASDWDIQGAGDPSIQGFATAISVNHGETVRFKIKTTAASYRLDIYRLGFYAGMGARKVATIAPSAALPQTQPACLTDAVTGLVDCGNWAESAAWLVPADATSGIYFARLVRPDTGGASHVVFVVRDDERRSELLFQTSDTTWQAYNSYGGNSLYVGAPAGRAYKVSYNRPFNNRDNTGGPLESWLFAAEYPMVRWLEANGYDVSYSTGADTDRRAAEVLEHKVFLSVGHDEYWSAAQRSAVETARNAGVHLAFFSGNEMFWKTRWESDASSVPYRTLVCYKETKAGAKIDPDAAWTGTWRDPRFSPPADGGRPENALTGTIFMVNGTRHDAITVPAAEGKMRFWRDTPIASLAPGQIATLPQGTLGYEWDEDKDNGFRPAGLVRLSSTTVAVSNQYLLDYGNTYGVGSATHSLTLYRHSNGALVFGAGTVQWSWGLDATHDRAGGAADPRMQQATVNLLADMGVSGASLQAGLVAASPSTDAAPPSTTITSPANGGTVQSGAAVTITGTATDTGGVVANVEVSTDGGTTWHPAAGRESWTYVWTPYSPGSSTTSVTLLSRAVDDSGNLQAPAGVTVTVNPGPGLVAAYGFEEAGGTTARDQTANANHGTIAGPAWTSTGRFGGALSFDGVNDLVTINDAAVLDLTNAMTIEAWLYPTALTGWRTALLKETTNGLVYGLYAHDNVPRPAGYIKAGGTDVSAIGTSALPLNAWTHLSATFDGSTLRLYVNGVQTGATIVGGTITTSAGALRIGGNAIWGEYFQGSIDEVRVYARVLTPAEIQADMTTPVGGSAVPDTAPPAVAISSPASGAVLSGSLSVSASASDNVGVVGVQFLLDGATLGVEDTVAPYSVSWNTTGVADGNHVLAARARDAAGNIATSSNVTVSVSNAPDTTPPTVSISAPGAGASLTGATLVSATAADNVAVVGVQFLLDGAPLGAEDLTAPFSTSWETSATPNGTHALTARARDAAGNQTTSSSVSVTVSNTTGLVASYGFSEGSGTTVADLSGNGRVGTITGAQWTTSGRFGSALSFNGAGNWVTIADANALDLTTGMTLEAWVNPAVLSAWRTVIMKEAPSGLAYGIYAHDNAPHPSATINTGANDLVTPGVSALPVGAWSHLAATYDGASLRLYVNGVQVNSTAIPGAIRVTTSPLRLGGNAPWGEYFQGLIDEVRVFNRARTPAEIQADMNAPVDSGPADTEAPGAPAGLSATGGIGSVSLTWTAATDNTGVAKYNLHRSSSSGFTPSAGNRIAQPTSTSYSDTGLMPQTYYYRVTAQDAAGNVSASSNLASAVVTVDTTAPSAAVTAPTAGATVSGTVSVSASASDDVGVAGVQFLLDGAALGAEDTTAPYSLSWDTWTAVNGSHTLSARARDAAGNQFTSAVVAVTVSNTAAPPPAGLVAAYGFNEGVGTTVGDVSGNGNIGTLSGATWATAGKFGKALSFDGAGAWVTVPDANGLDLTTGMTLEAWINPTALSGWRVVAMKETASGLSYGMYANNNVPNPAGTVRVGTTDYEVLGTGTVPLNAWTHLATTYDGAALRFYVNGVLAGTSSVTGSIVTSNNVLRIGGNALWGEYFAGRIDEVRIYNRALVASEIQADMNNPTEIPVADTTPPAISRFLPESAAAGVSPAASVHVTFSEAIDVLTLANGGIELRDAAGVPVPAAVTYDAATKTARLTPSAVLGPAQIYTAFVKGGSTDPRVKDFAGNALASTATWTFTTSDDTVPRGQWSAAVNWPNVAVHMTLLHTGKVLTWQDNGGVTAYLGDPVTGLFTAVPTPNNSNIYCAGQVTLADGRVAVVGGHGTATGTLGSNALNLFNPVTEQWTSGPNMSRIRWYPSALTLGDGRVLAMSGGSNCFTCQVDVPEIYDPALNTWSLLSSAVWAAPFYPFTFQAPDGRVIYAGSSEDKFETRALTVPTQQWEVVDAFVVDGSTAAMYEPGKIMKSGTAGDAALPTVPAEAATHVIDVTQPAPRWRATLPMAYPRAYQNFVILPDGNVLATGGELKNDGIDLTQAVLPAEMWSPHTESWTTMASMAVPRLYHSTALLLPDGRVVAAGGGAKNQVQDATDMMNAEIYSPPYLFRGPRPTITAVPSGITYGGAFTVTTPDAIASVSLIRPGATTHAFDMNQRFLKLAFQTVPGGISVTAPANGNLAPPGYYMLFILNSKGVPSVASFVKLSTSAPVPDTTAPTAAITAPAPAATVSGTITVSATASDNVGVAGVQFLLDGAVLGAEDTTAPYSISWDTRTAANGTHTVSARARDAAGNQATSTAVSVTVSNVAPPPPAGLIAAYAFDEGTGTSAADASGKAHTGTISGASWSTAGRNGGALSFDGVNDWVTVADAADLDLTTGMTLEAWVRPSVLSGWNTVIMKEGATTNTMSYGLYANDSDPWPAVTVRISSDRSAVGTTQLPAGAWTHLAATYDGTTLRLYVNGVQVGSRAQTGSMSVSTRVLRIGGNLMWGEYFNGLIDDVRIYNRALTATEIQGDMVTPVR